MYRRSAFFVLAAFAALLPAGCNPKEKPLEDDVRIQKPFSIDLSKRRTSTLLDRVEDERGQTSDTNQISSADPIRSAGAARTQGSGLFSFGSSGVDDIQIAAKDENAPLDLRLLETDTVEAAYKVHFDRGEELLRRGQYDQSLICFDEAKNINPKYYQAYVGEAFAYFRKADYGRAEAAINQAIRVAPQIVVLYNHRAHIFAQLGEFRRAVDDLNHVLKMQPEDVSSLLSRAQCLVQLNNHPAAMTDYTAALKLRPNDPAILIQRAAAYYRSGKYDECVTDATAVIDQRRDQFDPFLVRAAARANLNDLEGGKSDFDQAVKLGLPANQVAMWRPRFYPNEPQATGS